MGVLASHLGFDFSGADAVESAVLAIEFAVGVDVGVAKWL